MGGLVRFFLITPLLVLGAMVFAYLDFSDSRKESDDETEYGEIGYQA